MTDHENKGPPQGEGADCAREMLAADAAETWERAAYYWRDCYLRERSRKEQETHAKERDTLRARVAARDARIAELDAQVAKLEAERDMLRSECRRLACGDFFVTDDGRTVSCGMPDGHGGPCFQYKCSEEA